VVLAGLTPMADKLVPLLQAKLPPAPAPDAVSVVLVLAQMVGLAGEITAVGTAFTVRLKAVLVMLLQPDTTTE